MLIRAMLFHTIERKCYVDTNRIDNAYKDITINFQIRNEFVQIKDKLKRLRILNDIRFCELLLNQLDLTFEQLVLIFDKMIDDMF